MSDTLQRFLFEHAAVRGELVQLDASWQAVLERHDYPPAVREPLGELIVASVLLAATMKFNGSITLQVRGDGPINLLVVDCSPHHGEDEGGPLYHIRGMASWSGEVPEGDLQGRFGNGNLVLTVDPGPGSKRYQGIVELAGSSVAEAIDDYLERSEQLPTRMWLTAGEQRAAGLLLQKLPAERLEDGETWNRLTTLAATITDEELLSLEQQEVIHRLFHEEDIRLFESQPVAFHCTCSSERVAETLRGMGRDEVMGIIDSEGAVEVICQFCNRHYRYDVVDAERLFAGVSPAGESTTRH
ncbi:MAG: Hsp33 family molecular chaperone HslO [Gammaproteobacteria bacterium]|nr:Hsp33 family molecular chaperone HslO [Gammaproteobacteria bacterium]MCW8840233.1 Hsp33 family molecular chaperone HslO [Gammaproteobacteria bacterium]MCW8958890.1 Hsp33 family molecular chaperone HslO [Gammaproteobacteria bacterium]MCW8972653.1 Hsp33 family molecular chaperone HslO [Gammaproteobacteria bacterium]MCW8992382.1 Hsp33 family molecular chaperone HslO [Gammaproteobacteria bacterium]